MAGQSTLNITSSYANNITTTPLANSGGASSAAAAGTNNTLIDKGAVSYQATFTPGTGASQCDTFFRDSQAIANTTSAPITVSYDLTALPPLGGSTIPLAMVRVRKVVVQNNSISVAATDPTTNLGGAVLTVAPATTNGWSNGLGGPIPILPGGILAIVQPDTPGIATQSGANDTFVVSVPANSLAAWQVIIEGCSG